MVLKLKIGPHVQLELVLVALSDIFPMHLCFVVIMYSRVELNITSCWFIVEYPKKGSLSKLSLWHPNL